MRCGFALLSISQALGNPKAMDRTSYHLPFSLQTIPHWPCPKCRASHLTLVPNSLIYKETLESRRAHHDENWEPDWVSYVFVCIFECASPSCREVVSCCGDGYVEGDYDEDGHVGNDLFRPKYFNPPLVLMDLPKNCPSEAVSHLSESFALFFADSGAALSSVRSAVEAILTNLRVKRFILVKRKRKPLNLHRRIELLPAKYDELKDLLIAVKWLGNAGSHDGKNPATEDVRTAYDLLEQVISRIYDPNEGKLKGIAKKGEQEEGAASVRPPKRGHSLARKVLLGNAR